MFLPEIIHQSNHSRGWLTGSKCEMNWELWKLLLHAENENSLHVEILLCRNYET
jgi:hypothetical protein